MEDNVLLEKHLMSANIRVRIIRISDNWDFTLTQDEYNFYKKKSKIGMIIDPKCNKIHSFLKKCAEEKYFYDTYYWLLFAKSKAGAGELFENVSLNINAEVHIALLNYVGVWDIFDLYNPAGDHGGNVVTTQLGTYSNETGYSAERPTNKYWMRRNMTGVTFKSAVVIPHLVGSLDDYLENQSGRQVNSMHRFQHEAVKHCRDLYNFSLKVQRTNSWGYIQSNGQFDGLVRLLELRLVDFGSSPLIFKRDRLPVVDYSFGNWILRSTFIYRKPKLVAASYQIFLRPLSTYVWIAVVVAMTIIMIALKLSFSTEGLFLIKDHLVDSSWSMLFLFTLGAFCQQGATCYPRSFSSRILSVFVFLFCILIYQFYSASIVSYLLMDPPSDINNLQDLVDSQLQVGVEDILIDRNYFVQTQDPAAIQLYNMKIKDTTRGNDTGFYSPHVGIQLVQQGGFAFHVETSTAYPIIENTFTNEEICDLEEVQMYKTQPMHTNLQKHSPFKEMLNYCMLKMVEDGLMFRLRKYWDARKPSCIESSKKIEIHVNLKEFACGLIVLSYGVLISLFFLLTEIVSFKREDISRIIRNNIPRKTPIKPFRN